ncbi:MAG: AsnC family transcriptional regulator [Trueperaceae bacterium]
MPHGSRQLDPVDRNIVALLRADGRMAFREIARRLQVSESMIRKRVARLRRQRTIEIRAVVDPLRMGVPILATTHARLRPGRVDEITDRIARHPAVRYLAIGVGGHDVVLESLHADNGELHEFLQAELGRPGIVATETIQVVNIRKSVWDWEFPGGPAPDAPSAPQGRSA